MNVVPDFLPALLAATMFLFFVSTVQDRRRLLFELPTRLRSGRIGGWNPPRSMELGGSDIR